jgi:hypothetical protein
MKKNAVINGNAELRQAIRAEVRAALVEFGPILARLAAADTIHTTERAETVLERAVKEGRLARRLMDGKTEEA